MYTLTFVFNKDRDKVLLCWHYKHNNFNAIGGKVNEMEHPMDASYRELFEETGIRRDDIDLHFIRHESVSTAAGSFVNTWQMFITAGVLKHDVELVTEKNPLCWISVEDKDVFLYGAGNGNLFTFLMEAIKTVPELKGIKI